MRLLSFATACALFLSFAAVVYSAEPAVNNPNPIRYQKEVAPIVAEAMAGFPIVMERFEKGLPKGSELHVSVRLVDSLAHITQAGYQLHQIKDGVIQDSWVALAEVWVSKVDLTKGEITGQITNKLPSYTGYAPGDKITIPVVNLVDWKIVTREGVTEGGIFAKFLATKGPGADASQILADEEMVAKRELLASPEFQQAVGRSYLQLFDDPDLKIDYERNPSPFVGAWPELVKKYGKLTAVDLLTGLHARAETLKPALRFDISKPPSSDEIKKAARIDGAFYEVGVFVVMKRKGYVFEVRQLLHFFYRKGVLEQVRWGSRFVRPIKLKPQAG